MSSDRRAVRGDVLRALTEQATIQIPGITTARAALAVETAGFDAVGFDGPTWMADEWGQMSHPAAAQVRPPIAALERLIQSVRRTVAACRISVIVDVGPFSLEATLAQTIVSDLTTTGAAGVIGVAPPEWFGLDRAASDGLQDADRWDQGRRWLESVVAGRPDESMVLGLAIDASSLVPPRGGETGRQEADRQERFDRLVAMAEPFHTAGIDWLVVAGVAELPTLERLAGAVPMPLVASFRQGTALPPDLPTLAGLGYTAAFHADLLAQVERHVRRTALAVMARDGGPQDLGDLLREPT